MKFSMWCYRKKGHFVVVVPSLFLKNRQSVAIGKGPRRAHVEQRAAFHQCHQLTREPRLVGAPVPEHSRWIHPTLAACFEKPCVDRADLGSAEIRG